MTSQLQKPLDDSNPNENNACPAPTIKVEDDRTGMDLKTTLFRGKNCSSVSDAIV